jgi:hypothetical protein
MSLENLLYKSSQFVVKGNQAVRMVITDIPENRNYVLTGNDLKVFNDRIRWKPKSVEFVLKDIVKAFKEQELNKASGA